MKSRMSLIFCALVVILVSMVWVVRDRGSAGDVALTPAVAPAPMMVQTVAAPLPAVAATVVTGTPAIPAEAPAAKTGPLVHVATDGNVAYTARAGDTVSELATALRGSDSKENREAVIASNESLQKNPDRVLDGKTYTLQPVAADAAAAPAAADDVAVVAKPDSQREMKYIAQPGDNVAVLAASLLGGDTKTNRDAVIGSNASLQRDPDHLVAGKTYTITTTSGLAAAAAPSAAAADIAPTTQPVSDDADDAARMSAGRVLRYTAQPGDTLSKLATVLLGSDTQANREAIMNNNHALKMDPDHLVAGKTYWIAAPTAAADGATAP